MAPPARFRAGLVGWSFRPRPGQGQRPDPPVRRLVHRRLSSSDLHPESQTQARADPKMTAETFEPLDPAIHSPLRLAVLSILLSAKQADFGFLKKATEATDGNLSTHLARSEER